MKKIDSENNKKLNVDLKKFYYDRIPIWSIQSAFSFFWNSSWINFKNTHRYRLFVDRYYWSAKTFFPKYLTDYCLMLLILECDISKYYENIDICITNDS